jgi:hypothetical protein
MSAAKVSWQREITMQKVFAIGGERDLFFPTLSW